MIAKNSSDKYHCTEKFTYETHSIGTEGKKKVFYTRQVASTIVKTCNIFFQQRICQKDILWNKYLRTQGKLWHIYTILKNSSTQPHDVSWFSWRTGWAVPTRRWEQIICLYILYLKHRVQKGKCWKPECWLAPDQKDVRQDSEHSRCNLSPPPDYTDLNTMKEQLRDDWCYFPESWIYKLTIWASLKLEYFC